ncbi:Alpha/Beta hydrolase protein [Schizophyllum fasciatum]
MSSERTITTARNVSFKVLDAGPPKTDRYGADYLTLVFLHGWGMPSIGITERLASIAPANDVRLIAVNRRGYPGSSPYTPDEARVLKDGTVEERAAFYRDEGHQYAHLLDALVQDGTVGVGGIALAAWSIGNAHLSATIAAVHELPDAVRERLSRFIKTFIYFEAVPKPMGVPNPPGYIPTDEAASATWFASYFAHDLAARDVAKLQMRDADPARPPTDAQEGFYAKYADVSGALNADEALFKPDILPALRAAGQAALFSADVRRAWGDPKVAYVFGGSSVWTAVWMAWTIEDELRARGSDTPEIIFKVVGGANHYAVFDHAEETLQAFLECVKAAEA